MGAGMTKMDLRISQASPTRGHKFLCPVCGGPTFVWDTRALESGVGIQRRRKCQKGHQFQTEEKATGLR